MLRCPNKPASLILRNKLLIAIQGTIDSFARFHVCNCKTHTHFFHTQMGSCIQEHTNECINQYLQQDFFLIIMLFQCNYTLLFIFLIFAVYKAGEIAIGTLVFLLYVLINLMPI